MGLNLMLHYKKKGKSEIVFLDYCEVLPPIGSTIQLTDNDGFSHGVNITAYLYDFKRHKECESSYSLRGCIKAFGEAS
jgi:hypothetical protein